MTQKPTYAELEKQFKQLQKETAKHKAAEKELLKSEELYRTLVDNSPY